MPESPHIVTPEELVDEAVEMPHDEDGVDVSLIRWMLSWTPEERLDVLQSQAQVLLEFRTQLDVGLSELDSGQGYVVGEVWAADAKTRGRTRRQKASK